MSNPPQAFFPFELRYLVGIETLDSQHRKIVDLVNKLYASAVTKKPADSPFGILLQLVTLAKTHFDAEEQVMLVHSYPGYDRHKAAHEGLGQNLIQYRDQIARRERELTVEYVDLLKLWLIDHFAEFDMGYARFIAGENETGPHEERLKSQGQASGLNP